MNTLRALFVHNDWARARLVACAEELGESRLDEPIEMGPGSLRKTLAHVWHTERRWLDRWLQRESAAPDRLDDLALAELDERFESTAREREAHLDAVGPAGGAQRIEYTDSTGVSRSLPLGDLVLNVCNHGFHHRAQAVHMLRRLGATPPNIDYLHMVMDEERPADASFDVDTLAEYYRYGDWATDRICALVAERPDADLDRARDMGVGSLRRTLLHMHDAERWWLDLWLGRPGDQFQARPETTPIAELREAMRETARKRNEYLACLANEDLNREVVAERGDDRAHPFRIGEAMAQICGHGAHHRAQAINMLRRDGVAAPLVDYILWIAADAID